MPMLDVSDVLDDPDFLDCTLKCTRNTQSVGTDGIAKNAAAVTPFSGVVTSDSGDILMRMAEGSYVKGSILVTTRFVLIDGAAGKDADIVTWNGRQYTVSSVNDYSTYGSGFVEAICEPIALTG